MSAAEQKGFSHAWRAMRHRNFRLFFVGQSLSLTGSWMTRIAVSWLVYRLTKSPLALGVIGFAQQAPVLFLSPIAGVIIDRMDRRTMLILTQALAMTQSVLLAVLTLTHHINMYEIFAISIVQGFISTLDMPLRQTFMMRMVEDRNDLPNAIAINSSMVNSARLIGPSIAGLVIAASSEGWCFVLDGLSYLAVLASLFAMRMTRIKPEHTSSNVMMQLREGWVYVSGSLPIRSILLLFAVSSLMGYPFMTLMPIFAAQVLGGGAHTMGFLMGAIGVGALLSAIGMAMRRTVLGLILLMPLSALLFGLSLIGFGLSRNLALSLVLLLVAGFGMIQVIGCANTVLQTIVEERVRGRVMSYYIMAFQGVAPIGSLLAGSLAQAIGATWTVIISGVACIAGGSWFWMRLQPIKTELRPIYEKLGILEPCQSAPEDCADV